MGLFKKHDGSIAKRFDEIFEAGATQAESEFLDSLNEIIKMIEVDSSYSTNETPKSHWENLFAQNDGRKYNAKVGELFSYSLNL